MSASRGAVRIPFPNLSTVRAQRTVPQPAARARITFPSAEQKYPASVSPLLSPTLSAMEPENTFSRLARLSANPSMSPRAAGPAPTDEEQRDERVDHLARDVGAERRETQDDNVQHRVATAVERKVYQIAGGFIPNAAHSWRAGP